MRKIQIETFFLEHDNWQALEVEDRNLMASAIAIRKGAYAPYSQFRVGAAVLLENGVIVVGSNQENAAFPSGLCAERNAIFQAAALYPNVIIKKIAISASSDLNITNSPIPPCGACRQSLLEYEVKQEQPIKMFFMGATGTVCETPSILNLLPFHFDKSAL